ASIPGSTVGAPRAKKSWGRRLWTFLRRRDNRMGIIGLILLIPVVAGLLFAPLLTPHDPTTQNILQRLKPPAWMEGGNERHLLGTDHLGRDILARVLYGGRISLLVGFASVLLSAP